MCTATTKEKIENAMESFCDGYFLIFIFRPDIYFIIQRTIVPTEHLNIEKKNIYILVRFKETPLQFRFDVIVSEYGF